MKVGFVGCVVVYIINGDFIFIFEFLGYGYINGMWQLSGNVGGQGDVVDVFVVVVVGHLVAVEQVFVIIKDLIYVV